MTESAYDPALTTDAELEARKRRIARRYAAERRFRWLGIAAVSVAVGFLVLLLSTVVRQGLPAFTTHELVLPIDLREVDPVDPGSADYDRLVRDALAEAFPFAEGRTARRAVRGIVSTGSGYLLSQRAAAGELMAGQKEPVPLLVDDFVDLYLKGQVAGRSRTIEAEQAGGGAITLSGIEPDDVTFDVPSEGFAAAVAEAVGAEAGADDLELTSRRPSVLLYGAGGTIKLTAIEGETVTAEILVPPASATFDDWSLRRIAQSESTRKIDDRTIAYVDKLEEGGAVRSVFNTTFFSGGASREPELAGIWGAAVGSFLTLVVTLLVSFPIGVAAAIYLEEFAPKNRLTGLIEVNINNLAAVPSIVFGLLGLAVFLNWFGMPRSAPLVGGLVLALMTLPTIIIASRAAIRAVPPSIREAALGVGASKVQAVFHHVLPLAMPGILTGSIIGMAQALGETAPLLMIGMVAFIVDIPGGFTDAATVLPVQIFMWADFPEPGFRQKTSAAIMVLLAFLVAMNALAVFLRRRFERRW